MSSDWFAQASALQVDDLQLEGRDLEIARIVAAETEAERERRFQSLTPISEEESKQLATSPFPAGGLLGGDPLQTRGQARRARIDAIPWDELLRGSMAHAMCVQRSGLGFVELIGFVIDKCRPRSWEVLFWYQQWVKEAINDKIPRETLNELLALKQAESAAAERHSQASRGGAAKGAKYAEAEKWLVAQWLKEGSRWDSKRKFAETFKERLAGEFSVTVAVSTITDVWLSPSRLTGKSGGGPDLPVNRGAAPETSS